MARVTMKNGEQVTTRKSAHNDPRAAAQLDPQEDGAPNSHRAAKPNIIQTAAFAVSCLAFLVTFMALVYSMHRNNQLDARETRRNRDENQRKFWDLLGKAGEIVGSTLMMPMGQPGLVPMMVPMPASDGRMGIERLADTLVGLYVGQAYDLLKADPDRFSAHDRIALAGFLLPLRRLADAEEVLRAAVDELDKPSEQLILAYRQLGQIALLSGRRHDGRKELKRAIDMIGGVYPAKLQSLARFDIEEVWTAAELVIGDADEAAKHLQSARGALADAPDSDVKTLAEQRLSVVAARLKKRKEAAKRSGDLSVTTKSG